MAWKSQEMMINVRLNGFRNVSMYSVYVNASVYI